MSYPPEPEPITWVDVVALVVMVALIVGAVGAGIAYVVLHW